MLLELLKAVVLGIVEGITEWLPISSTGHMILVDEFLKLNVSADFLKLFLVVIQLGAIMAVIILYFDKLNPFSRRKSVEQRRGTWFIWAKVAVGTIPAGIVGALLDDWAGEHLYGPITVSIALIVYGVVFIVMEARNRRLIDETCRGRHSKARLRQEAERGRLAESGTVDPSELDASSAIASVNDFSQLSFGKAFAIGCFQALAVVPGTSRSGSTIIGSMLLGTSRTIAAEFAFFLAIPIMFGWSAVKVIKYGLAWSGMEYAILAVGMVVAFVVSVLSIRFLMGYIRKNDFTPFGWYRIILGVLILGYFGLTGQLLV